MCNDKEPIDKDIDASSKMRTLYKRKTILTGYGLYTG